MSGDKAGSHNKNNNNLYYIQGLDCPDCAKALERDIAGLPQVEQVKLLFALGKLEVTSRQDEVLGEELNQKITSIISSHGCKISGANTELGDLDQPLVGPVDRLFSRLGEGGTISAIISGGVLLVAVLLSLLQLPTFLIIGCYTGAILIGGWATFRQGFKSLSKLQFDMNVLMTVAVIGAVFIGEWLEGAIIAFLFSLSNTLENYSMEKTRQSIKELMSLAPEVATIKRPQAISGENPGAGG